MWCKSTYKQTWLENLCHHSFCNGGMCGIQTAKS
jgi:hypothetical protein